MADTQDDTTQHKQAQMNPETHDGREDYLRRILQELSTAFSAAIAGDFVIPPGTKSIPTQHHIRCLRDQLQSLQSQFMSALRSVGYSGATIETPSKPITASVDAGTLGYIRAVRDSKSGYGRATGFCIVTVGELFFDRALPWAPIAMEYLEVCCTATKAFLVSILSLLAPEAVGTVIMGAILDPLMNEILPECKLKLSDVLAPSTQGFPVLYDPGFLEYIHDRRQQLAKVEMTNRLHEYVSSRTVQNITGNRLFKDPSSAVNVTIAPDHVVDYLTTRTRAEADEYACAEMLFCAQGIYQNALAIFQNNVPVQCIEIGLLARLNAAISPDLIMHIDPETIDSVIPESSEIRLERNGLKAKQGNVAVHAEKCLIPNLGTFAPDLSSPTPIAIVSASPQQAMQNFIQIAATTNGELQPTADPSESNISTPASAAPIAPTDLASSKQPASGSAVHTSKLAMPISSGPPIPGVVSADPCSRAIPGSHDFGGIPPSPLGVFNSPTGPSKPIPLLFSSSTSFGSTSSPTGSIKPVGTSPGPWNLSGTSPVNDPSGTTSRTANVTNETPFSFATPPVKPTETSKSLSKGNASQSNLFSLPSSTAIVPWAFPKHGDGTPRPSDRLVSPSWSDCPGTATSEAFSPVVETMPACEGKGVYLYHSLSLSGSLRDFSPEECRLADYGAGRRFVNIFRLL